MKEDEFPYIFDIVDYGAIPYGVKEYLEQFAKSEKDFIPFVGFDIEGTTIYLINARLNPLKRLQNDQKRLTEDLGAINPQSLKPYFNQFLSGYRKGYNELEKKLSSTISNEQTALNILSFISPTSIKKITSFQGVFSTWNSKGDYYIITKESFFAGGISEGEIYKAWELILKNAALFNKLIMDQKLKYYQQNKHFYFAGSALNPVFKVQDFDHVDEKLQRHIIDCQHIIKSLEGREALKFKQNKVDEFQKLKNLQNVSSIKIILEEAIQIFSKIKEAPSEDFKFMYGRERLSIIYRKWQKYEVIDENLTTEEDFINVFLNKWSDHDSTITLAWETNRASLLLEEFRKHFIKKGFYTRIGESRKLITNGGEPLLQSNITSSISNAKKYSKITQEFKDEIEFLTSFDRE